MIRRADNICTNHPLPSLDEISIHSKRKMTSEYGPKQGGAKIKVACGRLAVGDIQNPDRCGDGTVNNNTSPLRNQPLLVRVVYSCPEQRYSRDNKQADPQQECAFGRHSSGVLRHEALHASPKAFKGWHSVTIYSSGSLYRISVLGGIIDTTCTSISC